MITAKDWWGVLTNYNNQIFPLQFIVMGTAAVLLLFLYLKPCKITNALMKGFLSLANLWNGIMFFMILGTNLPSPLRFIQGSLFIAIGIFLAIDVFTGKTELTWPHSKGVRTITVILLTLVAIYPIVGLLRGHTAVQLIYPGTVPCATTSLSLVLLSASLPKVNKIPYVLLLIWAIPFAPLIQIPQFKVYEDSIMFIVGIYSLIALIISLRKEKARV